MTDSLALAESLRDYYLKAHRLLDQAMKREGISYARLKLLVFIGHAGSARATDIADFFGYAPRTVTEAVDALEREGLVARVPDPNDRRVKNISLTEAGDAIVGQAGPVRQYWLERVFSVLDAHERDALLAILDRMTAHMDALSSALPDPDEPPGCGVDLFGAGKRA